MLTEKFKMLIPYARTAFQSRANVQKALTPFMLLHGASQSQTPQRSLATKALTRNIELISNSSKEILTDTQNPMRLQRGGSERRNDEERPLSILFCWLMSQKAHILKYANFYLDQGFDVLTVQTTPWQLLWPVKGTQLIAKDIVTFMSQNPQYNSTMIHGFSVGGYLWGEVLNMLEEEHNRELVDRIVGQIWDSVVDFEGIPTGLPKAVFPNNAVLRASLQKYVTYHMDKFYDVATKHYLRSSACYHNSIVQAPALFLCSLDDPVGNKEGIDKVINSWDKKGIKVYLRAWDSSPHVSHLHHHPKEYKEEMKAFLEKLGLVPYPEKFVHKVSVRQ